jgi:GLPGLI family protein
MKKLFLLSVFAIVSTLGLYAQMTQGHISYKIDASTDNPDMQMAIGMMQGSTMDIYFKDKTTRSEMKMGSMMTVTTITDETSKDVLMLMSGMMGNIAVKSNLSEYEDSREEQPKFEVSFTDETKDFLGYTCKKAVLTSEDGLESVFWYTEEIMASKKGQSYLNEEIPGFPMQFELNNQGMKMSMTVTALEEKLEKKKSSSLFDMTIPAGYKEMTMEELGSMGM